MVFYRRNYRKRRSTYRRRRTGLNRRRFYKSKIARRNLVMTNTTRPSLNIPIAPKYRTKLTASAMFTLPATADPNGVFYVKLNSIYRPFQFVSNTLVISGGLDKLTLNPRGYANLMGSLYTKYRVYASKISVTGVPHSVLDSFLLTVYPSEDTQGSVDPLQAQNIAYSKEKMVNSNASMGSNTVHNYIDLCSLRGENRTQVMCNDQLSGAVSQDPPALSNWYINYRSSQPDRTGEENHNNSVVTFNIDIVYYVELFEMNYDQMSL